jgi:hypothetical protein
MMDAIIFFSSTTDATAENENKLFSALNCAIVLVSVAFIYLGIMLYQIFQSDFSDGSLQNDDNFYSLGSEGYGSSYDEFTNSHYLRSDSDNSLID